MKKTGLTLAMIFLALCTSMSALAGTTLKLAFTSGNNYIKKVVVTEGTTVHTFDFSKNVNDLGTFQGSDSDPKEIASTEDAEYKAIINAQSGKYQTHSDQYGAQINVGTFMTFDVDGDATVTTTVSYNGTGSLELFAGEVSCGTAEFDAVGDYAIEFTASALPKTAKWDFKAAEPSTITGVNIQGTTGTVASTLEGCEMTVDASNSGKLQYNASGYAQYNKNTILRIPVATTNDVVTVEAYPGQYKYTVGGVAAEGNTTVHTATAEEVAAGYVEIIATGGAYINSIVAVYAPIVAEQYVPSTWDGKAEVWDFGQAVVEGANNYITADVINDWYKQANGSYKDAASAKTFADAEAMAEGIASATGWTLPSFTTGDLSFEAGGKTNHRHRTTQTNVIRYDSKSYTGYNGYIYSNAGSTETVYVALDNCKQGDKIEYVLGTNGNPGTFVFANEEGVVAQENITTIPTAVTFCVPTDGTYRVYCTNEKLTVARITRTHAGNARVSGTVSALTASDEAITGEDLKSVFASTKLVFTNKEINVAKEVEIASDGKFEVVNIPSGYTYTVSSLLPDYIVAAGITVEIPVKDGESVDVALTDKDVALKMIDKVAVSGSIVGMDNTSKLVLVPSSSELFVPEFNISGTTYSVVLQKGVQYTLVAEGVNDYELKTTSMQSDADASIDIEFEKKAVYDITIAPTVATVSDLASAKFTFTRLDDKYTYNFTGAENIKLRDGVYSVKVTNAGAFAQLLTSNLVVSGAATTKAIDFKTDINEWNFADGDFVNALSYNGLTSTNGQVNKTYLLASTGTVTIPVKKGDLVTIKGCYQMTFQFEGEEAVATKSGSTGTIETYTYTYNGEAATATITISGTTYFTYISAVSPVEFASTINVGATRECKTISEALAVVDMMSRPAGEAGRVTIMIDPGNYEEMPVVNSDYVTFKNSASEPSIALKNKGVDIDENAVRITSYYGEGYRYYSCGSDNKWNERVLAVSKDNGECTYECYGGSTNESYWNATVVIKGKNFIAEDIIFENSFNQYVSAKEANDVVVNKKGNNPSGTKVDNGIIRPTTVGSTAVQDKKYVERAAAIAVIGDRAVLNRCAVIGRQDSFYGHTKVRVACYQCELYGATDYIFGSQDMIVYDSKLVMNTSDDKNDQAYLIALKAPSYKGSLFMNCEVVSTVPGVNTASTYKSKPGYLGRPWEAAENATFANVTVDVTDYNYGGNDYSGKSLLVSKAWNSSLGGVAVNSFEYNINYNGAERISGGYAGTELTDAEAEEVTLYAYTEGNDEWDPFAELFAIDSKKSAYSIATPIEEVIADTMVGDKDVVSTEYYSINGQKVSEGFQGMVVKVVRYSDGSKDAIKMMKK
ncbi:MAG: pectinesterase family protein [Bacteroidales bacterium]|nr:pectinesterase family protein [Bacteroidales bacterium]